MIFYSLLLFFLSTKTPEVLAGDSGPQRPDCQTSLSKQTETIPKDRASKIELGFTWAPGTSEDSAKKALILDTLKEIDRIFPSIAWPRKLNIVMTSKREGLATRIAPWRVTLSDLLSGPDLKKVFLHEFGHILFRIALYRTAFASKGRNIVGTTLPVKGYSLIYDGIEEFFADLLTVLVTLDQKSIRECCDHLYIVDPPLDPWPLFQRRWHRYRDFSVPITLDEFKDQILPFCQEGNRIYRTENFKNEFDEVHGYFGWLRARVGVHFETIKKNRADFINRFLQIAAFWDASLREKENDSVLEKVIAANEFFAEELGINDNP